MTLTALITINAILAGAVVSVIVGLLGSAIRADRDPHASRRGTYAEPARPQAAVERVAA